MSNYKLNPRDNFAEKFLYFIQKFYMMYKKKINFSYSIVFHATLERRFRKVFLIQKVRLTEHKGFSSGD